MSLGSIIHDVNSRCGKTVFDIGEMKHGLEFIENNYPKLSFKQHGGSCICLDIGTNFYVKFCKKNNDTMKKFKFYLEKSLENDLTIESKVVYEDDHCVVYEQLIIKEITDITPNIVKQILLSFHKYIELGFKPTDVYHRNYGLLHGKVYMYDLHDFAALDSDNTLNVRNLFCLFDKLFNNNMSVLHGNRCIKDFIKNGGAKNLISNTYVKYLDGLIKNDYANIQSRLDAVLYDLDNGFDNLHLNYQHLRVVDTHLEIFGHTKEKYLLAKKVIDSDPSISSVLDAGCSIGGIGSKIAQKYPNTKVMLNNITKNELETAKKIVKDSNLSNVDTSDTNLFDINKKYDLTMYFAILHHIFRFHTPEKVIDMVRRQTNKYAVIEVPLKGDALLAKLLNHSNHWGNNFFILDSVESFTMFLSKNNLKVLESNKIIYPNSPDLNRYYFITQIIN